MKALASSYARALDARDTRTFNAQLEAMKVAINAARQGTPTALMREPVGGEKYKDYQQGLTRLVAQIDKAETYARAGDLARAKGEAEGFKLLRNHYHKKYK
jgi:soluble cytochrome b562